MDVEQRRYTKLVPLIEILAHTTGKGRAAKSVGAAYHHICDELGGEIQVLTQAGYGDLEQVGGEALANAVTKIRSGQVAIVPGFDGQYGTVLPAD
jgi:PHP family Zn ribbon phosphoesterase